MIIQTGVLFYILIRFTQTALSGIHGIQYIIIVQSWQIYVVNIYTRNVQLRYYDDKKVLTFGL